MSRKTSSDSWDLFLNHRVHRESRTIIIGWDEDAAEDDKGEITMKMALDVIGAVALLESDSTEKPVTIILYSPGGSESAGWAIYDVLVNSPCPVTVKAVGECMSIATLILQAGDTRLVYSNTVAMVHGGTDGTPPADHQMSADRWHEFNKAWRSRYYRVLADRTGKPAKYWRRKCTFDFLMTADDLVKEGLADQVLGKSPGAQEPDSEE